MTFLKRFGIALAFCFAASVPSWAQSAPVVYVAAGDSQVYAVTPSGSVNPLIPTSGINSSAQFTSLTVGPDNTADNASANTSFFLYACDTAASTSSA